MCTSEEQRRSQWKQWIAALIAVLPSMAVGFLELMVIDIIDPLRYFANLLMTIGCMIGAIFGTVSADIFGRKKTLLTTTICAIAGITHMFSKYSVESLCLIWLIGGFNAGIACTVVPVYISEIADDNIRGGLLMLQLCGIYAGQFVAAIGEKEIVYIYLIVIPILFLIAIFWFPESPYYLVLKKRYKIATKSLAFFRGINQEIAEVEIQVVINSVNGDGSSKGMCQKFLDLFKSKHRTARIIVALLIILHWDKAFTNQTPGLATALNDTTSIGKNNALKVVSAIQLIWSGILVFTIDKVGRRLFLLGSTLGGSFVAIVAVIMIMFESDSFLVINFTFQLCQIITFGISLVFVTELFPTILRSTVCATALIFGTIFRSAVIFIGWKSRDKNDVRYWTLVPLYLLSFLFILAFVPETKQRTFSDIQNILASTRLDSEGITVLQPNKIKNIKSKNYKQCSV